MTIVLSWLCLRNAENFKVRQIDCSISRIPLSSASFGTFYSSGRWEIPCTTELDCCDYLICKTNDVPSTLLLTYSTVAPMSLWSKMIRRGWLASPKIPPSHLGIWETLRTRELLKRKGACEFCCKIQRALSLYLCDIPVEGMEFIALRVKTTAHPLSSRNQAIFCASPTHWRNIWTDLKSKNYPKR